MGEPEPTFDNEKIRALSEYLAEQHGGRVVIKEVNRPKGTGFSAETLLLSIESNRLPDKLVVQAAPAQSSALFEHYTIGRTFETQRLLSEYGVPVPCMRWLCEDEKVIGTSFYVMDFVTGRVPTDRPAYHKAGWLKEADLEVQSSVWMSGLAGMAALHQVPGDVLPFHHQPDAGKVAGSRILQWQAFADSLGEGCDPILVNALQQLGDCAPVMSRVAAHWGDAKLGNMIFQDGRLNAILDWELSGVSAPEEDLTHWFAVDWFLSSAQRNDRLPGLPNVEASVAHYVKKAGYDVAALDWWFAFALIRMALIFERAKLVASGTWPNLLLAHVEDILAGSTFSQYQQTHTGS